MFFTPDFLEAEEPGAAVLEEGAAMVVVVRVVRLV
jgi:hypothetical protein